MDRFQASVAKIQNPWRLLLEMLVAAVGLAVFLLARFGIFGGVIVTSAGLVIALAAMALVALEHSAALRHHWGLTMAFFLGVVALIVSLGLVVGPEKDAPRQADRNKYVVASACGDSNSSVRGGWGPDRPTFTVQQQAPYTTLNSIRDNPYFGDERGLVGVRDTSSPKDAGWAYAIGVQRDRTYRVRAYVHNLTISGAKDVGATAVTLAVNLPTCSGQRIAVNAFVRSDSAFPGEIWGGVTFTASEDFNLAYVEGSAILENNHWVKGGIPLGRSIFTSSGVMLGYDALDGRIPPGYQYAAYISFEVRPQFAPGNLNAGASARFK